MTDLDWLMELAQAATPGPWHLTPTRIVGGAHAVTILGTLEAKLTDAAFIAACDPATVIALIQRVKAVERPTSLVEANARADAAEARVTELEADMKRRTDLAESVMSRYEAERDRLWAGITALADKWADGCASPDTHGLADDLRALCSPTADEGNDRG